MAAALGATCTVKGAWEAALAADAVPLVARSKESIRAIWQGFI
jgi:hypothetical protein